MSQNFGTLNFRCWFACLLHWMLGQNKNGGCGPINAPRLVTLRWVAVNHQGCCKSPRLWWNLLPKSGCNCSKHIQSFQGLSKSADTSYITILPKKISIKRWAFSKQRINSRKKSRSLAQAYNLYSLEDMSPENQWLEDEFPIDLVPF